MVIYNKDTSNPDNIEIMEHAKGPLSSHAVLGEVAIKDIISWLERLHNYLDSQSTFDFNNDHDMSDADELKKLIVKIKGDFA